ncbi:MAG: outer membrane protein transport protein [Burkholderiales bacterium]|nr:outer membrane protein transport protein [Burkholderiales bacterium]
MKYTNKIIGLSVASALTAFSVPALAGGFGIGTQSGSGTGNAFAGGAAAADDASVAWSNPAAMMLLPPGKQATFAAHLILPSFKFNNTGSTIPGALGSGNGGDGGDPALVPNGFFTMSINPKLHFGLALNVPFGLATKYDQGWQGQTVALESAIKTININPSLAYKINDNVSIGGGVSIQRIEAKLSRFTGSAVTGNVTLEAGDTGYGFNLGALFKLTPSTRIGITYRSAISYDLKGSAIFSGTSAGLFSGNAAADLKVPASASWSIFSTLSPKWEVMGDLTYTGWSSVKQLPVIRTTTAPAGAAGTLLSNDQFNWKDTLRVSVGANYIYDDRTKLRFGIAFDPTPTNDIDRTPRLPDQDRTWLAFGVQYKLNKDGVIELGYAHEFVRDAQVNNATGIGGTRLIGSFSNKADILSVQYSHKF